jgi:hypothetical protein
MKTYFIELFYRFLAFTMVISPSINNLPVYGQFISDKNLAKTENDLIRKEVGLKYIYSFPLIRTEVRMLETGQQIEIPIFDNEVLIKPLMSRVLSGMITVYDPNFQGDINDLEYLSEKDIIDTTEILKYMDAGSDTSFLIDDAGNISLFQEYIQPDISEISGIFFMENWLLNTEHRLFHKDVIAYLPIRDYYASDDGLNLVIKRRLLFMAVSSKSLCTGSRKEKARNNGGYELICKDLSYELNLYNKPYSEYIYREELNNKISLQEYEEWEYHHFDFFRHFDRDIVLESIMSSIEQGVLKASKPDDPFIDLTAGELDQLLQVPLAEINSVIFREDWYLNQKNLDLAKVVKSIILVRHINEYDDYTGEFIRTRKDRLAEIKFNY